MSEEPFRPEDAAPPPPRQPAGIPGGVPPQPAMPYDAEPPDAVEQNRDARTWGMLCHLTSLSGYVVPFGNILGPLVCWLIKKDEYPFVDDQGKESLNFHITMTIIVIGVLVLGFITMCVFVGFVILIVGLLGAGIFDLVVTIIGTVKANGGEYYRYPFNFRFVK